MCVETENLLSRMTGNLYKSIQNQKITIHVCQKHQCKICYVTEKKGNWILLDLSYLFATDNVQMSAVQDTG